MSLSAWRRFRARQPGLPAWRIVWWHFLHFLCFVWVGPCYRYRAWHYDRVPAEGPVLLVSNHQSFLDPILVGLSAHHRQFYAMARSTLFRHPFFAWLIQSLNAIPVERGTADMGAMRRSIEVLQQGHALLIFPEGTRTPDGTTKPFATGTMLLIRRARPVVVPVAVEGAFSAWPRERRSPRAAGRIGVMFGEPIPAQELLAVKPEEALGRLRTIVESMRVELAHRLDPAHQETHPVGDPR
jgi:1-acyl-sn-glycerol-3-phosphate acyltransferase